MGLALLNDIPIIVYRKNTESYFKDGRWVEPDPNNDQEINIKGSIQPLTDGFTQIDLPEGVRNTDVFLVYTKTKLQYAEETTGQTPDEIEVDGYRYELYKSGNWNLHRMKRLRAKHYRHIFIRKDKLPDA